MKTNITLEEFYNKTGGNYNEACLKYKENLLEEALKFLHDSSFAELQTCIAASDYSGAYGSAAALCEQCEKLCFERLAETAERIKNKLCGTETFDDIELFSKVRNEYENTVKLLRKLETEN